jgi:DNA-directed RNA polymerase subunit H (RpoH/RPB5)
MNADKIEIFMEMMEDRKYVIQETSEEKIVIYSKNEEKIKNIFIFPFEDFWSQKGPILRQKEKIKHVSNEFMKKCVQETGNVDCIIVCPQVIAEKLFEDDYLEVISEQALSFNPMENENVPKHTLFKRGGQGTDTQQGPQGTQGFDSHHALKGTEGTDDFYPIISIDDPIVRWYGFKKGDVIKIDREYCGETYYRVVS